ncbi:MAG: hypothetical protein Q8914_14620, partial [Bacteroidota bacterium]|nr:hypothetical protein [Bacteroidota bacterium]
MKKLLMCITAASLFMACCTTKQHETMSSIKEKTILATIDSILAKSPQADTSLLKRGIRNAASFWKSADGTEKAFQTFCINHFMATPEEKATLFNTVQKNLEIINGHYNRISMELKEPVQLAGPSYTSIDEAFGALDPYAHFADDMFDSKIAFSVLLNFPFYTLQEKNTLGNRWNRQEWAYARMGDLFTSRVPAELSQHVSTELATTENYISNYNIRMDNLRSEDGRKLFADSLSLIAHWGLRDELKADYADKKEGLEKQQLIYEVMKRIIDQSIPEQVINNGKLTWKPYSNKVFDGTKELAVKPEPDTRYKRLFETYKAMKETDPFSKCYPTALKRAFDRDMEVSADNIESMFTLLIASPEVAKVAAVIKKRLGRNLQPFDLWYDGFKTRSTIPEDRLTRQTQTLYPNTQAFEKNMPDILIKMGFNQADAKDISARILVDNSRGSGHAWGAQMRSDKAHLRTRIQPSGMD